MSYNKTIFIILLCIPTIFSSCYSFKGISIPPETNTFSVAQFELNTAQAPSNMGQNFTVALINKIRNESKLQLEKQKPDVEFKGAIQRFNVEPINPEPNSTVSNNRLSIDISVEYIPQNKSEAWTQKFSYFEDFPASVNLLSIQDQIIENAFEQITDEIFNKAFTNW